MSHQFCQQNCYKHQALFPHHYFNFSNQRISLFRQPTSSNLQSDNLIVNRFTSLITKSLNITKSLSQDLWEGVKIIKCIELEGFWERADKFTKKIIIHESTKTLKSSVQRFIFNRQSHQAARFGLPCFRLGRCLALFEHLVFLPRTIFLFQSRSDHFNSRYSTFHSHIAFS